MFDKKTFVLAVAVSWALTLVTVLLISNFAPRLIQQFNPQFVSLQSVKVVILQKQGEMNVSTVVEYSETPVNILDLNFTWTPTNLKDNAVLGIVCSFEYRVVQPNQEPWIFVFGINVNDFEYYWDSINVNTVFASEEWKFLSLKINPKPKDMTWINPNQSEYQIVIHLSHVIEAQTYVRNVNLMLLVTDG